jgi:hypothetical protein
MVGASYISDNWYAFLSANTTRWNEMRVRGESLFELKVNVIACQTYRMLFERRVHNYLNLIRCSWRCVCPLGHCDQNGSPEAETHKQQESFLTDDKKNAPCLTDLMFGTESSSMVGYRK